MKFEQSNWIYDVMHYFLPLFICILQLYIVLVLEFFDHTRVLMIIIVMRGFPDIY
jgi:hypothetical protein